MTTATNQRLTAHQRLDLGLLLRNEYATAGMGARGFAAYASQRLGFLVLSHQIHALRRTLGIAPHRPRSPAKTSSAAERVERLKAKALRTQQRLERAQVAVAAARAMAAKLQTQLAGLQGAA